MIDLYFYPASHPRKFARLSDEAGLRYQLDDHLGDCRHLVRDLYRATDMSSWHWMARATFVRVGADDVLMYQDVTSTLPMQKLRTGDHRSFISKPARAAADAICSGVDENTFEVTRSAEMREQTIALKREDRAASNRRFGGMIGPLEEAVPDHYAL